MTLSGYALESQAPSGVDRNSERSMSYDKSGGGNPTLVELEAGRRAGMKRIGENGLPHLPPTPEQQEATNRVRTTVRHHPKPCSQETGRVEDKS